MPTCRRRLFAVNRLERPTRGCSERSTASLHEAVHFRAHATRDDPHRRPAILRRRRLPQGIAGLRQRHPGSDSSFVTPSPTRRSSRCLTIGWSISRERRRRADQRSGSVVRGARSAARLPSGASFSCLTGTHRDRRPVRTPAGPDGAANQIVTPLSPPSSRPGEFVRPVAEAKYLGVCLVRAGLGVSQGGRRGDESPGATDRRRAVLGRLAWSSAATAHLRGLPGRVSSTRWRDDAARASSGRG